MNRRYLIHNRYALLIGVDRYADGRLPRLQQTIYDVREIELVLKRHGYIVRTLHGGHSRKDLAPTRANIMAELQNITGMTGPGDLLLIHYGGHGVLDEKGNAYLIPSDGRLAALPQTAVNLEEFKEMILRAGAQAKILILDACHSGIGFGETRGSGVMSPEFEKHVFLESVGTATLAACRQGETAYNHDQSPHGVFTHYLLEGLKGAAAREQRRFITFSDLNEYVTGSVKSWAVERGACQRPNAMTWLEGDPPILELSAESPLKTSRFWLRGSHPETERAPADGRKGIPFLWILPWAPQGVLLLLTGAGLAGGRREELFYTSSVWFWSALCGGNLWFLRHSYSRIKSRFRQIRRDGAPALRQTFTPDCSFSDKPSFSQVLKTSFIIVTVAPFAAINYHLLRQLPFSSLLFLPTILSGVLLMTVGNHSEKKQPSAGKKTGFVLLNAVMVVFMALGMLGGNRMSYLYRESVEKIVFPTDAGFKTRPAGAPGQPGEQKSKNDIGHIKKPEMNSRFSKGTGNPLRDHREKPVAGTEETTDPAAETVNQTITVYAADPEDARKKAETEIRAMIGHNGIRSARIIGIRFIAREDTDKNRYYVVLAVTLNKEDK